MKYIRSFNSMNKVISDFVKAAMFPVLLLLGSVGIKAYGQGTFVSGSTGADGAFNPTSSQTIQLPESGIFNFTTVNIPTNVLITFEKNSRNTPVIILATGNINITGGIHIHGKSSYGVFGGDGGPGGFKGGDGGRTFEHPDGFPGEGPGGGIGGKRKEDGSKTFGAVAGHRFGGIVDNNIVGGASYGNNQLSVLIGGSGGGGQSASLTDYGNGAAGGGGAILIASSTEIIFQGGFINATSPSVGNVVGGSGGAIKLIANKISGPAGIYINGGWGGSVGYFRVESFDQTQFTPSYFDYSQGLPGPVFLPNLPTLTITKVGGVNAPSNPAAAFRANPDIIVPTSVSNPVTVNIQATNIPVGTVVQIMQTSDVNTRTIINSTPLAGTNASSTATATVTLPTTGMCILNASATLNALTAFGYPVHYDGERVDKVEIAANDDKSSGVFLVTVSGKRVKWPN